MSKNNDDIKNKNQSNKIENKSIMVLDGQFISLENTEILILLINIDQISQFKLMCLF